MSNVHVKDLLSKIINNGYNVKINHREVKGKIVLFMNYRKMIDGKTTQQTKRLVTLSGKVADKKEDLLKINQAHLYRAEFEKNIKIDTDVFNKKANSVLLIDFVDEVTNSFKNKTRVNYLTVKKHLFNYTSPKTTLSQIDKQFCLGFVEYIMTKRNKAGSNLLKTFKAIMNRAIDKELVSDMPYLRKMNIKYNNPKREYLTHEELSIIYQTPFHNEEVKYGFIFGCFTGLRFVDLNNLKFSDIKEGRLTIKQQKTQEVISIMLNDTALEILERQKQKNKDKVFSFSSYSVWRENVKKMVKQAGIDKTITGHCARHTFATSLLTNKVDIYTVSKLLGHHDVKVTQIYAHLIDDIKDEAIMKLPKL